MQIKFLRFDLIKLASFAIAITLSVFVLFQATYCAPYTKARSSFGTSPVLRRDIIQQGYTLIVPRTEKAVYLVDLFGKAVHTWQTSLAPFHALLKKNGHLVVALVVNENDQDFPSGGSSGLIQELDWQGNVVWEYRNTLLHHDFEILPNGNIAALVWEPVPAEISSQIGGGIPGTEYQGKIWSDAIIEIDRDGKVVWEWHAYEHLDPHTNKIEQIVPRAEWTHANSIRYISESDPQVFLPESASRIEAFLMSFRDISSVVVISKKSGKLLWQSPRGMFSFQHDATLLPNGHFLVFDNGYVRLPKPENPRGSFASRVVQLDPATNKIVWEFKNIEKATRFQFIAPIVSGAQRLSNGNTLITNGVQGHIFETALQDDRNMVVWDFLNPYGASKTSPWPRGFIFKARRYSLDDIDWPEKLPSSLPPLALACEQTRKYIFGR